MPRCAEVAISTVKRDQLLERYREMDDDELLELRRSSLTEIAAQVYSEVITERGLAARFQENTTNQDRIVSGEPRGLGGWLVLLVVLMLAFKPIGMLAGTLRAVSMAEQQFPAITSLPNWSTYQLTHLIGAAVIGAISFYGGIGLARGRTWKVVIRAQVALWICGPLATIIFSVVLPLLLFGEDAVMPWDAMKNFVVSVLSATLWTTYLAVSKRVRNTYGCPPWESEGCTERPRI